MEGKNNGDSLRVAVIIGRLVDGVKFNASRSETFPAKNVAWGSARLAQIVTSTHSAQWASKRGWARNQLSIFINCWLFKKICSRKEVPRETTTVASISARRCQTAKHTAVSLLSMVDCRHRSDIPVSYFQGWAESSSQFSSPAGSLLPTLPGPVISLAPDTAERQPQKYVTRKSKVFTNFNEMFPLQRTFRN